MTADQGLAWRIWFPPKSGEAEAMLAHKAVLQGKSADHDEYGDEG